MKIYNILAIALLVHGPQAIASSPNFGAQVQLNHVADGNDRADIQMNNFTGTWVWASSSYLPVEVLTFPYTANGFDPAGWQAQLSPNGPSSWLTTLQWLHTETDNPFWEQNYNIWCGTACPGTYLNSGWYNFWLMTYPYSENSIITDLELAWHVVESAVDVAKIVCGDEEAWESLGKNVIEAINEGNEIANEPNAAWAAITYPDNSFITPIANLYYPILPTTGTKRDHLAVNISGQYVAQVVSVNAQSSLTGNTQFIVNLYTMNQWQNGYSGTPYPPPPAVFSVSPTVLSLSGVPFPPAQTLTFYNTQGAISFKDPSGGDPAVYRQYTTQCAVAATQCTMQVIVSNQMMPQPNSVIATDGVSSVTITLQ